MADWASGSPRGAAGTEDERFARAEREADWLRQEQAAGRISDEQFKARLQDLMVQDAAGAWWAVGQHSGEWYRSEGGQWVRASPAEKRRDSAGLGASPPTRSAPGPDYAAPPPMPAVTRRQRHRAAALLVSVVCLFVVPLLAYSCGKALFFSTWRSNAELAATYSTLLFLLAGVVGAVVAFRVAGRWWRGE